MISNRAWHGLPGLACRKALVAAEDPQARRHIKEALARAGYASDVYSDSRMILDRPEPAGHSFLILESGEAEADVVRELRRRGGTLPVIMLSGGPRRGRFGEAGVGPLEYLPTPFTLKTLRLAIARALA